MSQRNIETLEQFTIETIPNLDVAVLGALELFGKVSLPVFDFNHFKRPLVIGSLNAAVTGEILFDSHDAVFADESDFESKIQATPEIDGVVLISASGGKHAVRIAETLKKYPLETWLLTNNEDARAGHFIESEHIILFPKNREPYTYNTSTYLGMILSKTKEDPAQIYEFLTKEVHATIPQNLASFDSFYFIVPTQFHLASALFMTKFDELFGSKVSCRAFTFEQTEHAKTVVPSDKEFFISFGEENKVFGNGGTRFFVPFPEISGYAAMVAIGYYIIGYIQQQHPPYFKENIATYTKLASQLFNQPINSIVE